MTGDTLDPAIIAIVEFVEESCRIAVAEATGFYPASVTEPAKAEARQKFSTEMMKLSQDEGN